MMKIRIISALIGIAACSFLSASPAFAEGLNDGTVNEETLEFQTGTIEGRNISVPSSSVRELVLPKRGENNTDVSLGLNGSQLVMLKGTQQGQQVSIVLRTPEGKLIVFDGGTKDNASVLSQFIRDNGGEVSAWFLTHPHEDHCGALASMIEGGGMGVTIDRIYYAFAPLAFYEQYEEGYRLPFIREIYQDLQGYDQSKVSYNSAPGTVVNVGSVSVTIMNQAYQSPIDPGNNTSIVYKADMGGRKLLVLGDLPYEAAQVLMTMYQPQDLKADLVQMAHHGQHGASYAFYQEVAPSAALWPTHSALWAERNDPYDADQTVYTIALTKSWIDSLNVRKNYVMASGNWILK